MKTFKIELEIPATIEVVSRGQTVEADLQAFAKANAGNMVTGLIHGFTQKIADGASGAKRVAEESDDMSPEEAAVTLMQTVVDQLAEGNWGRTRSGGGLTERDRVALIVVRSWIKSGANAAAKSKYDGFSEQSERDAFVAEVWADNMDAFADAVDAEVESRKAEAERKAKAAKAITVEI